MQAERLRAVTDFSRDIAVDASAGTGKTATLVARLTNLFLERKELSPDRVLLLTFTDKAAAEMKSRVTEGWERLLSACRLLDSVDAVRERILAWNSLVRIPDAGYPSLDDLRLRVEELSAGVGRLSVTTFHSFCARVLRTFAAEAGVDPKFEVLTEGDAGEAWDRAFTRFLRGEFGGEAVDPAWARIFSDAAEPAPVWSMIRRLCLRQRDLLAAGELDFGSEEVFLAHLRRAYGPQVEWFRAFVAGIADPDHAMTPLLSGALDALEEAWADVERGDLAAARAKAPGGLSAFDFRADRTRSKKSFPQPPGATLAEARNALQGFWRELAEVPSGHEAACFLVGRARVALAHYEEAKGSGLDFMDLLLSADRLLSRNPAAAARLSRRFLHIFVDEFQDTDPLQADMLRALAADGLPGRLFVVGDPKQSIYAFRRADIQVYQMFRRELLDRSGTDIALERNFRSRPELVRAINGLFSHVFTGGEDFSPSYSLILPERKDAGEGSAVTLYTLGEEAQEPDFLCALIRRITETVTVGGKGGAPPRPASFRDIAVLYRSDTGGDTVAAWRGALIAAGIPHTVPARRGFFGRQEVQDLRMVLAAVDAPADPAARYAALKTLFFGLSDEEILPLYLGDGASAPPRARDALAVLARLSAARGRRSLSGLVADLFRETGVEFVAGRLPEGERIVQNLAKAAAMARAFEWAGGGSVKAFLSDIRRKTEGEWEESEVPPFEEGEDVVRLSTIHASKGLEFPVVILANLSRGGRKNPEGLRVDRVRGRAAILFPGFRTYSAYASVSSGGSEVTFEEWEREKQRAEEKRLLYVAATRARDRLFLVDGARGQGSEIRDALRQGLARAAEGGGGECRVTGLAGTRRLFPGGGELLEVPVAEAPPCVAPGAAVLPPCPEATAPPLPEPPPAPSLPEPVSLREFHERERARMFGEKVHAVLEAWPPVVSPWPPPGARLPFAWGEGEEERWREIAARMARHPFHRELCEMEFVGTEVPLFDLHGGRSFEERADLVVRVPREMRGPGGRDEYRVVDFKTGLREPAEEESHFLQVRAYMRTLAESWRVEVRGFLWYVEEDVVLEAGPIRGGRDGNG